MNREEVLEQKQSIPYTETHIITVEDLKQAYYKGYLDGIKDRGDQHEK